MPVHRACTLTHHPDREESRNHAKSGSRSVPSLRSHVHTPPSMHMGNRQQILAARKEPRKSAQKHAPTITTTLLPCAAPPDNTPQLPESIL